MIHLVTVSELSSEPARPLALPQGPLPEASAPTVDARRRALLISLLHDELTLAPQRVQQLARRELARFRGDVVVVSAHPEDAALLSHAQLTEDNELERLELREDATLTRGGLLFESPRGTVDARVETRIERMMELLCGESP